MSTETKPETGTREQLETLARWMGWEVEVSPDGVDAFARVAGSEGYFLSASWRVVGAPEWNPWTDANAAEQLMERAKGLGCWPSIFPAGDGWRAEVVAVVGEYNTTFIAYAPSPKEAIASAIYAAVKAQEESHAG